MWLSLRIALAAAAITVQPALAAAQGRAGVVVLSGSGASEQLESVVRDLASRRGLALISRRPDQPGPSPVPGLVARAAEAYQGFRYAEAVQKVDAALAALERGEIFGVSAELIADALIYRGLARSALGDQQSTWSDFVAAATILPSRILDPVRFPPTAVQTFERARAEVAELGRSAVVIQAPDRCRLNIDGDEVAGPRQLVHGRHYLGVECGGRRRGHVLEVIGPMEQPAPLPPSVEIGVDEVRAIASERGAEVAVWVEVKGGEQPTARVLGIDLDSGARARRVVGTSRAALARGLRDVIAIGRPVVEKPPVVREEGRWYRSPFLWGAVGAAVAAAIILPLTQGEDDSDNFSVRPQGSLP